MSVDQADKFLDDKLKSLAREYPLMDENNMMPRVDKFAVGVESFQRILATLNACALISHFENGGHA